MIALVLCGWGWMRIRLILAALIGADRQDAGAGNGAGGGAGSGRSSCRSGRSRGAAAGALAGTGDDLELRPPQISNVAAATTAETGMWMDVEMKEMKLKMATARCCSQVKASLGRRSC